MKANSLTSAVVIGGGPAGLMAAQVLAEGGIQVELYEAKPSPGRKFLVAGKGGLNLTHAEAYEKFRTRYGERQEQIEPLLRQFGPKEVQRWAAELGVDTFVGSSGRVFPVGMKSMPLLRAWLGYLHSLGVTFHTRNEWTGWHANGRLRFRTPEGEHLAEGGATVLALGGASWPVTGSNGKWIPTLSKRGITIAAFKPANCGFNVRWTEHFRTRFAGAPVKAVVAKFLGVNGRTFQQQGEFIITENGVEGSLIYACSAFLRDALDTQGEATLHLDMAPGWTIERLVARLSERRGNRSHSSHLKKAVGIEGVKSGLLWEFVPRDDFTDAFRLAEAIKDLCIPLESARPLEEAISSAGGVTFESLDKHLMLQALPGVFCAGEMLDWEAPTGGYLLTACLSSGRWAGLGALEWLQDK